MKQPIHILHLEDDPADRELIRENLDAAGLKYEITGVQTGAEFDKALRQGGYDVILSDFRLPAYDGMSALRLVQDLCPDIPFIFVSGTMGEDAAIEGLTKGATDYVLKQKLSRLIPAIRRALTEAENRSERQSAEKKLFQANERWGKTFDAVPDLVAILDRDFRIVQANKAMAGRLGLTPEECIGQFCHKLCHKTDPPPSYCPYVQTLKDGKEHVVEVREERLGGEFILSTSPMFDSQGQMIGAVHVARDITERKKAEDEIMRLNETLEQRVKERTSELEAFSYSVSHDLRAPLRTIDGFSQVLLEDYEDKLDDEGKSYLARIKHATINMGNLIEDMLKLYKVSRTEMTIAPVNLSAIARSITDELYHTQPERLADFIIADNLEALADPGLIRVVFENLLGNAWKFTSKRAKTEIEFGLTKKDNQNVYFIRDNGAGFDMEYADKLFAPFQRLHSIEEYSGTGIGLAIVKRIINRHGGRVWAEAQSGKGATFYFTLQE